MTTPWWVRFWVRIVQFFCRHDWEEITPSPEEVAQYGTYFEYYDGDDDHNEPYRDPRYGSNHAPYDRVCMKCDLTDLRFARLLERGRLDYLDRKRLKPFIEKERLERLKEAKEAEEKERREKMLRQAKAAKLRRMVLEYDQPWSDTADPTNPKGAPAQSPGKDRA